LPLKTFRALGSKRSFDRTMSSGLTRDVTAEFKVEIRAPAVVTALISREAVEDLDIEVGDAVEAAVKATEVMIAE